MALRPRIRNLRDNSDGDSDAGGGHCVAGLVLLYLAVRDLVNRPVAILVFVVLCFDNSLFWLTREDVGPSAIEFFLKCAALLCAARVARAPSRRWTVLLVGALGIGVFNKLNFIWTVNAAVVVSGLLIFRYRASVHAYRRVMTIWVGGLAVIYTLFAWYYLADHIGSLVTPSTHSSLLGYAWPQFERGTKAILSGTWFYDYPLKSLAARELVVLIVVALFVVGAVTSTVGRSARNVAVSAVALVTLLIAIQNVFTVEATAGWHYISIYPYVAIVACYGAWAVAGAVLRREVRVWIALACVAGASLVYDAALLAKYFDALADEPTLLTVVARDLLASVTISHAAVNNLYTTGRGIFNPLFAIRPGRNTTELEFALESPTAANLHAIGTMIAAHARTEADRNARRPQTRVPDGQCQPAEGRWTPPPIGQEVRWQRRKRGVRGVFVSLGKAAEDTIVCACCRFRWMGVTNHNRSLRLRRNAYVEGHASALSGVAAGARETIVRISSNLPLVRYLTRRVGNEEHKMELFARAFEECRRILTSCALAISLALNSKWFDRGIESGTVPSARRSPS